MFPVPAPLPPPDVEARVSQIRFACRCWMSGWVDRGWIGWIGWLEAFLKDHEVEAEAWKSEVWWLVLFSLWSNYLWNTIWYFSKRVANSWETIHVNKYMVCSCWETPHSATVTLNTAENTLTHALALNIEMHTLHQLQSFSLLTLKNTKCKHHEDLETNSFWNERFAIHIFPTTPWKSFVCHSHWHLFLRWDVNAMPLVRREMTRCHP